jgi:hypothetical protein
LFFIKTAGRGSVHNGLSASGWARLQQFAKAPLGATVGWLFDQTAAPSDQ